MAYPKLGPKAPFPGFIRPALAQRLFRPPRGDDWIHELKFDGYRVQLHIANEAIKIFSRRGHDWTSRFTKITWDAQQISAHSAIVDGEVIVSAVGRRSGFAELQKELRAKRSDKVVMYAFDLLYLNGHDLRAVPLVDRKKRLRILLEKTDILVSEGFNVDGVTLFQHACKMGLEGIVSKRLSSRYRSDRSNDWIKATCRQSETLSIVGYSLKENRLNGLYLGRREGSNLLYAGKVDHGFSDDQVADLQEQLQPLAQKSQAYTKRIAKVKAVWVKPVLQAEIEYLAKYPDGKLRHLAFKGLRDDL